MKKWIGPSLLSLLPLYPASRRGLLFPLEAVVKRCGAPVRIPAPGSQVHFFLAPENVKELLQEKAAGYRRAYDDLFPILGTGLITADGESWKKQRKIASPVFHAKSLAFCLQVVVEEGRKLVDSWSKPEALARPLDVSEAMTDTTLNIAARCFLSADLSSDAPKIREQTQVMMKYLLSRLRSFVRLPMSWRTPGNIRFRNAIREVDTILFRLIRERRKLADTGEDFLGLLLKTRDEETGAPLPDNLIRDQMMTMLVAGHETTAHSLTWTLHLASLHPEKLQPMLVQTQMILADGRPPAWEDLKLLDEAVKIHREALRLFPPVWYLERISTARQELGGYPIPVGARVAVSPYLTHRDPEIWPDPEHFDPQRFTESKISERHKFAWFPFGGGPRSCIGQGFAQMEAQVLLTMLLQRFHFEPCPNWQVELEPLITLQPKNGLRLLIKKRKT